MWFVFLSGDNESLNVLSEKFSQKIKREEGIYRIKSSEFEKLNKSEDVFNCAENILKIMLGSLKVFEIPCKDLKIDHITNKDKNGMKHTYNTLKTTFKVIPSKIPTNEEFEELFKYAMNDEPLKKCLISYYDTTDETFYHKLYNIYEVIKQDLDKKEFDHLLDINNISKNEIDKFKRTANNYDLAGTKSRHAKKFYTSKKLSEPMSLEKSELLIKRLLKGYIKLKTKISLT